jgi:hypothetical protein
MADDPDFEYLILDSTIVRAHQHAAGAKKLGRQSWLADLLFQGGKVGGGIAPKAGAQGSSVASLVEPRAEIPPAVSADVAEVARVWRLEPCRGGGDQAHLTAQHGRG